MNKPNEYKSSHLSYFIKGLSGDPFIRLSLEDLMQEITEHPDLKSYVLNYAKNTLKENSLSDKRLTIRAIENENIDILYNHDSEVRENFAICFLEGAKAMQKDLSEQNKHLKSISRDSR